MLRATIFLATSWCFAQTARSKHYRALDLYRAPRATGVIINKLVRGERILEIYYEFQFSTYVQRGSHVGYK